MKSAIVSIDIILKGERNDARYYLPRKFNISDHPTIRWCTVTKLAIVEHKTVTPGRTPSKEFNYINLADVDEREGKIVGVHKTLGSKIKGGKVCAKSGNIIFARIEPSIYNKKSAIVPDNIDELVASTEFIVVVPKKGVSAKYLFWALRSDWLAAQITENLMRGSTGRRRLDPDDFSKLLIPDISSEAQNEISEMIITGQTKKEQLLFEIEELMKQLNKDILSAINKSDVFEDDSTERPSVQLTLDTK